MPTHHAILSPSGASRWLICTPSARLELRYPDSAGEAAAEGTLAHWLGELIIKRKLDQITQQKYNAELKKIKAHPLYNASMLGYCTDYAVFVLERFAEARAKDKTAQIFLETQIDLTRYIPQGFGTTDVTIVAQPVLETIDFKYGKGVHVSAQQNKQEMIYSLGSVEEHDSSFEIETVRVWIFQPRLDNIDSFEISVPDLKKWADNELIPKAKLAFAGQGEFVAGDHCRFCRVKDCRARAEKNLEIAKYDFAKPVNLRPDEVADILERQKELINWANDVGEYALTQALTGTTWPGYKLVNGRSNRVLTDTDTLGKELLKLGYMDDEIYRKDLLSLTALEGLVGKADFEEKFARHIIKPYGAATLVPLSDKRPAFGTASAISDFSKPLTAELTDEDVADLL